MHVRGILFLTFQCTSFQLEVAVHLLVAGLAPATSAPAPKLSNITVVGSSLVANMLYVGAQLEVHPRPVNFASSMQVWKASTLSLAELIGWEFTQSTNAVSQALNKICFILLIRRNPTPDYINFTSEQGSVIPRQPTCQNSLFLGSKWPPKIRILYFRFYDKNFILENQLNLPLIVPSSLGENLKSLASWPSFINVSYMLIAVFKVSGSLTAILSLS